MQAKKRISIKTIILVPVLILGIIAIFSNAEAIANIRRVDANAKEITDTYMVRISKLEQIQSANCVIAVAGMEGALASVLGGMVDKPVIAVPTSVGYGASMHGLSALLTMINSCANGVAVVNIDNGYGAGYLATQINRLGAKE